MKKKAALMHRKAAGQHRPMQHRLKQVPVRKAVKQKSHKSTLASRRL